MLGQIADGFVAGDCHDSLIRGQFAHDDAQQGCLAGAVNAHDGGLVVIFYMKRNIPEYRYFVKGFVNIADGEYHDAPYLSCMILCGRAGRRL